MKSTLRKCCLMAICLMAAPSLALAQDAPQVVVVQDDDINAGETVSWTSGTIYQLDGFVFVEDGATLNIEAGTVIWGQATPSTGDNASALIIARGATINATGTAEDPIVFTAEGDDPTDPADLPLDASGRWGGVIILGNAETNLADPGVGQIEGISEQEARAAYGGSDNADNSGTLEYVSIRHGGAALSPNNEINGLTLGAVGSGTTIRYVEVLRNLDDGFEWFGGTVNTKYLVSSFNGDDSFDYDNGFRGNGQFWFAIQAADAGDSAAEQDGGTSPEDGTPFATPTIYNATYIGRGAGAAAENRALRFRDNAGGQYYNSIFTEFGGEAVSIEDLASGEDSQARLDAGDLALQNNVFFGFNQGLTAVEDEDDVTSGAAVNNAAGVQTYLEDAAQSNLFVDPQLREISRTADGMLDPRPAEDSPVVADDVVLAPYPDDDGDFFDEVDYIGAFGTEDSDDDDDSGDDEGLWISGWTSLSQNGFLVTAIEQISQEVPERITLSQNYPNPFNPSTTIEYQLEKAQPVRLAVYDVLGRQVAVLADGVQPAGTFRADFDASNLASGMYLYKLETETNTLTRMMTLLK